jgi:hypothetical protein
MKRSLLVLALVLVAGALLWWRPQRIATTKPGSPPAAAPSQVAAPPPASKAPSPPEPAEEPSHLADNLNAPAGSIRADLQIMAEVIEAFRTNFSRDGNPVGDNAEITAALTGQNKLHLVLISRHHPAINARGELCDRWGTPFFFHAESGTRMGIRSAGPDKKMWTSDDVVLEP